MSQIQAMNAVFDALDRTVFLPRSTRLDPPCPTPQQQRKDDLIDDLRGLLRTVEDRCVHISEQWFDRYYDDFVDNLRAAARLLEPDATP